MNYIIKIIETLNSGGKASVNDLLSGGPIFEATDSDGKKILTTPFGSLVVMGKKFVDGRMTKKDI